ncbi:MAG: hypothetical protein FWD31_10065 [Planctomycetaceae bacterium]|nr:hypothetical protein [Planctomycetaceae bacterium]
MKKILLLALALGLLLVIFFVGIHLNWKSSVNDRWTYFSAKCQHGNFRITEEGELNFSVIEVVCKQKKPFDATLKLQYNPAEDNDGDTVLVKPVISADEIHNLPVSLPIHPAKYSYREGMWIAKFYVHGFDDGSIAVYDTFFGPKEQAEKAIVSLAPPQKDIIWGISASRSATYCESIIDTNDTMHVAVAYGWEGHWREKPVVLRFMLFVEAK